jgi:type I restriction enzyme S subunit
MIYKKLSEIADVNAGGTPSRARPDYWNGVIPWIKISNMHSDLTTEYDETITEKGLENSSAKIFKTGTILYTIFATLGNTSILGIDAATNQAIAGISIKDKTISPRYLLYFLKSLKPRILDIGKGVAQHNINLSILRNIKVPFLPNKEQQRIISTLDSISKLIQIKRNVALKLDCLTKSRFMEMQKFATSKEKIGVFFEEITKGPFGSDMKKSLYVPRDATTWKVYIQANVIEGDPSVGNYWISDDYFQKKCSRYEVKPEDILITCDGTLGKIYVLPENIERGVISSSLLKIRLKKDFLPLYFKYIWELEMLDEAISQVNNSALKHLPSAKAISKMTVPVLPLVCQQEFVNFLHQVDKSKFVVHSKYFL